jgi:hypothetical protein
MLACLVLGSVPALAGQARSRADLATTGAGGSYELAPDGFVLGRTTLSDVRRAWAVPERREPLAHARIPTPLAPPPRWHLAGATLRPALRVDATSATPTLYFDRLERLILVVDSAPRERLHRADFERRHPAATVVRDWGSAVELEARVEACVAIRALFDQPRGTLRQLASGYTCGTD